MRSLKGLWVGEVEVPFRRLNVHCFWMSGVVGGTGLLCNLTYLPVANIQRNTIESVLTGERNRRQKDTPPVKSLDKGVSTFFGYFLHRRYTLKTSIICSGKFHFFPFSIFHKCSFIVAMPSMAI